MRRPTRAQLLRRRSLAAAFLVVVSALALGLWARDSDSPSAPSATAETTTVPWATTEAAAETTVPPTTRSTGVFVPDAAPSGPAVGEGPLRTYRVEVEEGVGVAIEEFTAEVDRILSDPRGWTSADGISLQRVTGAEAEMTVTLATPATVDLLCYPLDTDGDVSCAQEGRAIINGKRWLEGAAPSELPLGSYREYLVSHELGHVLGHHHEPCPGPGVLAPVMVQQTLGIAPCAPNPWPAPDALTG
ncbi:MAG TPA: DUF3152 domain-containing protein [Iamia sp.]|nr:DUF3152 domain-containing protein [Iamia sp.]